MQHKWPSDDRDTDLYVRQSPACDGVSLGSTVVHEAAASLLDLQCSSSSSETLQQPNVNVN